MKLKLKTKTIQNLFQFGKSKSKAMGIIKITMPFTECFIVSTDVNVVTENVPFLIDLDLLNILKFYMYNVSIELCGNFSKHQSLYSKTLEVYFLSGIKIPSTNIRNK